jgi:hypothetical protein
MAKSKLDVLIDIERTCYDVHLTRGWSSRMFKLGERCEPLHDPIFDLVAELRGIAHSTRLPFEMIGGIGSYHDGFMQAPPIESPVERLTAAFCTRVARDLRTWTPQQITELQGVCLKIGHDEMQRIRTSPKLRFDADKAWSSMMTEAQFRISLWQAQRINYVGAYNAYESFVTRCIAAASKNPSFKKGSPQKYAEAIKTWLGPGVLTKCWDDDAIQEAIAVRNALSHNAGRRTPYTDRHAKTIRIPNGEVQITVTDVQNLIFCLEDRAFRLARAAADAPAQPCA